MRATLPPSGKGRFAGHTRTVGRGYRAAPFRGFDITQAEFARRVGLVKAICHDWNEEKKNRARGFCWQSVRSLASL